MTKLQQIVVSVSILLFLLLYFGASTKPSNQGKIEKKRALAAESTDINALLIAAKPSLDNQEATFILSLEQQVDEAATDSLKAERYKELSSKWYEYNRADIAGYYAEEVAQLENTEEAWSIAGTTFMIGSRQKREDKVKQFCVNRAIQAFEKAISLNPSNTDHQLNLAICYAENPPADNAMKGILMLLDLNKKHPEDVSVLINLGRFGMQTGQYEKAIERLTKAINLAPENAPAHCLLASAYEAQGAMTKANEFQAKCKTLSGFGQ